MRRTKEEALETREAILDAAETVFFERGVSRTSLAHIATEAKVTRGAIYWHFQGKGDLFKAMQHRACLPQEAFFQSRAATGCDDSLEALQETTLEALRRSAGDERAKRVYTIVLLRCEYVGDMRDALATTREAHAAMRAVFRDAFDRAASRGQLAPLWTPATATEAYLCAIGGLFFEWLRNEGGFDLLKTGEPLMRGLFASFKASEEAAREVRARCATG